MMMHSTKDSCSRRELKKSKVKGYEKGYDERTENARRNFRSIGILCCLVLCWSLCGVPRVVIAKNNGTDPFLGGVLGFLLEPIGLIIVALLKGKE